MTPPMTPRMHKVVALARREAVALQCNYVAPEHILMGILSEGDSKAFKILSAHGISMATIIDHMRLDEEEKQAIIDERNTALAKLTERDRELLGFPQHL